MSDLDHRSDALDERLEIVAKGSVLKTRTAFAGFCILAVLQLAVLGGILRITADTNRTVRDEVRVLERRNTELEKTNAQLEDVAGQATDWIVQLSAILRDHGIEPPEIVIRPKDEGG